MKKNITPKFTFNLSENIKNITNGKYTNINVNDENGLIVEIQNGEYIPAERLSIGTIDQLYLSLRISMIEEISKEKMPIILDEAFAYFDDERLENILKYLTQKYKQHQLIIFRRSAPSAHRPESRAGCQSRSQRQPQRSRRPPRGKPGTQFCGQLFPAFPVFLIQCIFYRNDGVFLHQFLPVCLW